MYFSVKYEKTQENPSSLRKT